MSDKSVRDPNQKGLVGLIAWLWRWSGLTPLQLAIPLLPGLLTLGAILGASLHFGIDIRRFLGDTANLARVHPLTGMLSNLGLIVWSATAFICLFAAVLIRDRETGDVYRFLLCFGLLTAFLLFDDTFQFHETLGERYFGIYETWTYEALAVFTAFLLFRFRKTILRSDFGLLLVALGFMASSNVVDFLPRWDIPWRVYWFAFAEESQKWLGILCWSAYFVRFSYQAVMTPERLMAPRAQAG